MFGSSIGALLLAFLPLWLALFEWPEEFVYRTSSAIAAVYIGTFVGVMVRTGLQLTRTGYPPRVPWFPSTVTLLLVVSTVCVAAGAVGWLRGSVAATYVGSLIALLLVSAMVLAVFLILLARLAKHN
jgi:hypothetical protein